MSVGRHVETRADVDIVIAAQAGDPRALDELISSYLPLVYNIVGRALRGHADVDDVVQETVLRAVRDLGALRDPASFRSWLVSITMRQIRNQWKTAMKSPVQHGGLGPDWDLADPAADFSELAVTRLRLSGQRRQVAEATAWLDPDDQQLLALWWLEASGDLSRDELARALSVSTAHAAMRVRRMKASLETARAVVAALAREPRCLILTGTIGRWDGEPNPLWRKRIARHVRDCPTCGCESSDLVPAEVLLNGMPLMPVPLVVAHALTGVTAGGHLIGVQAAGPLTGSVAAAIGHAVGPVLSRIGRLLAIKPVAVVAAGAVITAGIGGAYEIYPRPTPRPVARPAPRDTLVRPTPPAPVIAPPPTAAALPAPTASKQKIVRPTYGLVVDRAQAAPPPDQPPKALPHRPQGTPITGTGQFEDPAGGKYTMKYDGDHVALTGQGYFWIRWQIVYSSRAGALQMPTWTGLTGKLFHVASGGGKRMDDELPGASDPPHTGLGQPSTGYDTLPAGAQQMWQNEYYYLDGTVTLHLNENSAADYNLIVMPKTWDEITADVSTAPAPDQGGPIRYGFVRDTGHDTAPVPQYLTRKNPANPWSVPQHSHVS